MMNYFQYPYVWGLLKATAISKLKYFAKVLQKYMYSKISITYNNPLVGFYWK